MIYCTVLPSSYLRFVLITTFNPAIDDTTHYFQVLPLQPKQGLRSYNPQSVLPSVGPTILSRCSPQLLPSAASLGCQAGLKSLQLHAGVEGLRLLGSWDDHQEVRLGPACTHQHEHSRTNMGI